MRRQCAFSVLAVALCFGSLGCRVPTAPLSVDALVARLIDRNDAGIPAQLARQQRDRDAPCFGGIRAANGLYHAGAAAGFIRNLAAAYVSPESRYFGSPELREALDRAATFLLDVQHTDGTIDLLTTNFHSPPDTGFVLEWVCAATAVLQRAESPHSAALVEKLRAFIGRAADALAVGGIHTPNHRWVVCMALARANALMPDVRYTERIDTWLAEGTDIDPDGQFTERSTSIYSPLTNRCLITVARLLDRPELLEPVRRNLEMSLYYMHANGEIATEGSRRQDQYRRSSMVRYYYPYRYMALRDQNGRFAAVARQLEEQSFERLSGQLIHFLESDALARPMPSVEALPSDYERHFEHSDLVRIRRGSLSATILADNPSFFSLHNGSASVVVRFASAFFGKGQFAGAALRKEGDDWVLNQNLKGPYYQPIAEELRHPDGDWRAMAPARRTQSEVQELHATVRIREQPGGFDVDIELSGTDGVPVAIELGGSENASIGGAEPLVSAPGSHLMMHPTARLSVGSDTIHIHGGRADHAWTAVRGALPALPGPRLYVTGFTPLCHTLEFRR